MNVRLRSILLGLAKFASTAIALTLIVFAVIRVVSPHVGYFHWFGRMLVGNFGQGAPGRPVLLVFVEGLPNGVTLIVGSFAVAVGIGALLRMVSSRWPHVILSAILRSLRAVPFFWLAFVLEVEFLLKSRGQPSDIVQMLVAIFTLALFQIPSVVDATERDWSLRALARLFSDRLPETLGAALIAMRLFTVFDQQRGFLMAAQGQGFATVIGTLILSAFCVLLVRSLIHVLLARVDAERGANV